MLLIKDNIKSWIAKYIVKHINCFIRLKVSFKCSHLNWYWSSMFLINYFTVFKSLPTTIKVLLRQKWPSIYQGRKQLIRHEWGFPVLIDILIYRLCATYIDLFDLCTSVSDIMYSGLPSGLLCYGACAISWCLHFTSLPAPASLHQSVSCTLSIIMCSKMFSKVL